MKKKRGGEVTVRFSPGWRGSVLIMPETGPAIPVSPPGLKPRWTPTELPGLLFIYDARYGITMEDPNHVASVEDVSSGNNGILTRRSTGVPPYMALQVPFDPTGMDGHPAFDFRAENITCLESGMTDLEIGEVFTASFVVLAAMSEACTEDGRLLSFYGEADPAATDQGWASGRLLERAGKTNAIRTVRYEHSVITPIELDTIYRFGVAMDESSIIHYLNNVETARGPNHTQAFAPRGKLALGGQANNFVGHIPNTWDGPISLAIGGNVVWTFEEMAKLDAWIVEEFGLA